MNFYGRVCQYICLCAILLIPACTFAQESTPPPPRPTELELLERIVILLTRLTETVITDQYGAEIAIRMAQPSFLTLSERVTPQTPPQRKSNRSRPPSLPIASSTPSIVLTEGENHITITGDVPLSLTTFRLSFLTPISEELMPETVLLRRFEHDILFEESELTRVSTSTTYETTTFQPPLNPRTQESYHIVFPDELRGESFEYAVTWEGNGTVRSATLEHAPETLFTLTLNNDNTIESTITPFFDIATDFMHVFSFDIQNSSNGNITLQEMFLPVMASPVESVPTLVEQARLIIDGIEYGGAINEDGISFSNLEHTIADTETQTARIEVTIQGHAGAYITGQTLSVVLEESSVTAVVEATQEPVMFTGSGVGPTITLSFENTLLVSVLSISEMTELNDENNPNDDSAVLGILLEVSVTGSDIFIPDTLAQGIASDESGFSYRLLTDNTIEINDAPEDATLVSSDDSEAGHYRVSEGTPQTFTIEVTYGPLQSGVPVLLEISRMQYRYSINQSDLEMYTPTPPEDFRTGSVGG